MTSDEFFDMFKAVDEAANDVITDGEEQEEVAMETDEEGLLLITFIFLFITEQPDDMEDEFTLPVPNSTLLKCGCEEDTCIDKTK